MANPGTEIAILEAFDLAPVSGGAEMAQAIQEEMATMGQLDLPRVKFPSGGGISFVISRGEAARPEATEYLDGVILHHHAVNAYWSGPYAGGNTPPECGSMDGVLGTNAMTGSPRL